MPSICRFELNKPNATYFSGETITGAIFLTTTNVKSVRDVSIIILGEGKVKWNETNSTSNSDGSSSNQTTYYRSHEVYVNNSTFIQGEGNLPAGTHIYTFIIPLPSECPTSCEGKYGHIHYEISLKINRFYRFDNIYKQPITVIKSIDLNLNPSFKLPVIWEEVSNVCCWPCSKGKIIFTLKVPYGAYAPGQMVKYILHIVNHSMSDIDGYYYEFIKKMTFTANLPSRKQRHSKDNLAENSFNEKCLRLTNRLIEGAFIIPSTPPSTEASSIIHVEYILKFKVQISGCHSDCELKVPIVIGTIPLRESLAATQFIAVEPHDQISPRAAELPSPKDSKIFNDVPPSYGDIKPSSFEKATGISPPFIDTDTDESHRVVDFTPLYPMYNSTH